MLLYRKLQKNQWDERGNAAIGEAQVPSPKESRREGPSVSAKCGGRRELTITGGSLSDALCRRVGVTLCPLAVVGCSALGPADPNVSRKEPTKDRLRETKPGNVAETCPGQPKSFRI